MKNGWENIYGRDHNPEISINQESSDYDAFLENINGESMNNIDEDIGTLNDIASTGEDDNDNIDRSAQNKETHSDVLFQYIS